MTFNADNNYNITSYDKTKWEEYDRLEFANYAQNAQEFIQKIHKKLISTHRHKSNVYATEYSEQDIMNMLNTLIAKSNKQHVIENHWAIFNKHLDKNPSLKEDWDSLCMAIKLTEEDDDDE